MAYKKPQIVAKCAAKQSFVAGCAANRAYLDGCMKNSSTNRNCNTGILK